jgi:hypothetical protein
MNIKLRQYSGILFVVIVTLMISYLIMTRTSEQFVDKDRCGVDLPSCSGKNVRCMNGYCKSDMIPPYPTMSDLPLTPPTKY